MYKRLCLGIKRAGGSRRGRAQLTRGGNRRSEELVTKVLGSGRVEFCA